ncbi:hypothetical protein GGS21DRAFT_486292 [Xylaria nigripes]|nr:hypothetical protein GGS21DRAFT_486292 [Xylaria nigripes]
MSRHSDITMVDRPQDHEVEQQVEPPYSSRFPPREWTFNSVREIDIVWPISQDVRSSIFYSQWKELLGTMTIQVIGGIGENRYVRWVIEPNFYLIAGASAQLKQTLLAAFKRQALPLYVEASRGGPWGEYILNLLHDRRRTEAIYVQRYGYQNHVPCECCERRYIQSDGMTDRRGLWPFSTCVGIPGYANGACANCLFSIQGVRCTFATKGEAGIDRLRGTRNSHARNSRVNPLASPVKFEISGLELQTLTGERIRGQGFRGIAE